MREIFFMFKICKFGVRINLLLMGFLFVGGIAESRANKKLHWNGFASFYGSDSLSGAKLEGIESDPNFTNFTKVGLNLRSDFADNFAAIGQLLMDGGDKSETDRSVDWKVKADWLFLLYEANDSFSLRLGRQLFPAGITAEYQDVGAAYPFIGIPIHVAQLVPLKAFNGISADYKIPIGSQVLSIRALAGNEDKDIVFTSGAITGVNTNKIRNIFGGTLSLEGDGYLLRGEMIRADLTSKIDPGVIASVETIVSGVSLGAKSYIEMEVDRLMHYSLGFKWDKYDFVLYTEYMIIDGQNGTNMAIVSSNLIQGKFLDKAKGGYLVTGYRCGDILPYYMYSKSDWSKSGLVSDVHVQHALGINYQIDTDAIGKIEYREGMSEVGAGFATKVNSKARAWVAGVDIVF